MGAHPQTIEKSDLNLDLETRINVIRKQKEKWPWSDVIRTGLVYLVKLVNTYRVEEIQINNSENVLESEEKGPFLWLMAKHEAGDDFRYLVPSWLKLPNKPDIKIAKRESPNRYTRLVENTANFFLGNPLFFFRRTWLGEGGRTRKEKLMSVLRNKERIDMVLDHYLAGISAAMFVEGTTHTDGGLAPIQGGHYHCCKKAREDGTIDAVYMLPVGLTVDLLSGSKNWFTGEPRELAFVNPSKPILYEPMPGLPLEPTKGEIAQDLKHSKGRLREIFYDLTTITASQLGGEYIMWKTAQGDLSLSEEELLSVIRARAEHLNEIEGVVVDQALLDERKRRKRVHNLYHNLQRRGYVHEGVINREKVEDPLKKDKPYRFTNPLAYCANRLVEVAENRPRVDAILQKTKLPIQYEFSKS